MKYLYLFLAMLLLTGCASPMPGDTSEPAQVTEGTGTQQTVWEEIALKSNEFTVSPATVRFFGRHHVNIEKAVYGFYNSAAGITFGFTGSSLELRLSAGAYIDHWTNYVMVYIDDREPVPVRIGKEDWYTVATDLDPELRHTVRVVKSSMSNAGPVYIHKARLSQGARLYSVPVTTTHRIQVLGDSITCGYGTRWDGKEEEVTVFQGGDNSYAVMLAEALNAELEVVAISGIGVGNSEGNKPYPLMPAYLQQDMQNGVDCDFSRYVPEVVVIALGTNDVGHGNPASEFQANGKQMVQFIRQQYPDAIIVWTYGVMGGDSYTANVEEMIVDLRAAGDKKVYFLEMDPPTAEEAPYGQHGHPGQKTHRRMAQELAEFISHLTGWELEA